MVTLETEDVRGKAVYSDSYSDLANLEDRRPGFPRLNRRLFCYARRRLGGRHGNSLGGHQRHYGIVSPPMFLFLSDGESCMT
jgi:hypothetical protein